MQPIKSSPVLVDQIEVSPPVVVFADHRPMYDITSNVGPQRTPRKTPPRASPYPPSRSPSSVPPRHRRSHYASDEERSPTPGPSQPPSHRLNSPARSILKKTRFNTEGGSSQAPMSDSEDSEGNTDTEGETVPKPQGEMGRPNRGGYNLQAALNWDDEKYSEVKKYINSLVVQHLDCEIPFTHQPLQDLQIVRSQAKKRYPELRRYINQWATDDFIRSKIKIKKIALNKHSLVAEIAETRLRDAVEQTTKKLRDRKRS
ncbi:hypothetical protein K435DRAFT_860943 [Dendrothele bispora CBS 962.96]|uniref:Uncharacterized protein n=1 Tax=Dendrothele bispora (strain CBS 962.96) TaxID=1314807 RepID=A0A4S8LWL8_DENBC|nr:hypothetical protein K435DRAFT_860943 [Dendrothele bispora CBS 962.96]